MANCASACATYQTSGPQPGDQIIFKGGDTWHFGNSGATPYTGGTWDWGNGGWNGTSGNRIYLGVDQTWFTGGAWTRPVLTADNSTSTSQTLGACSFHSGSSNVLINLGNIQYVTLDNFEMLGMCQDSVNAPFGKDIYVAEGSSQFLLIENNYFHGWTHHQFNTPTVCSGAGPTGNCFNLFIFIGSGADGDVHANNVVDGSDSDPSGAGFDFTGGYDFHCNVVSHISQFICTDCHLLYNNLFDNWYDPGDGQSHGNMYESEGEHVGVNAFYNNVWQHSYTISTLYVTAGEGDGIWPEPSSSSTDYIFNNLDYDNQLGGNYFNIQNSGGGNVYVFNNVLQANSSAGNTGVLDCEGGSLTHAVNNYMVTDNSTGAFYGGTCSTATNETYTNSGSTTNGYTSAQSPYVYFPPSGAGVTVGAGTNETSGYCAALVTAAGIDPTLTDAAAACPSDTRYGASYDAVNHIASCPARTVNARGTTWDIGPFQFSGANFGFDLFLGGTFSGATIR